MEKIDLLRRIIIIGVLGAAPALGAAIALKNSVTESSSRFDTSYPDHPRGINTSTGSERFERSVPENPGSGFQERWRIVTSQPNR